MSRSDNKTLFVGKLSSRIHESDLEAEFVRYGKIRDIDYRKHRGFAFIEFSHSSDAYEALK
jgi:arginine/serine-rich splicing factor 7